MKNELLALAYDSVNPDKANRLRACATFLTFRVYEGGEKKLDGMNSCRVRLCPVCAWRRSLKNYYNNEQIARYLEMDKRGSWIALTLTVKSVKGEELNEAIDMLLYSWKKFTKNTQVKKVMKGYYRGLEVTHDCERFITKTSFERRKKYLTSLGLKVGDENPTYDLYHPHFHVLVHTDKSYPTSRKRLTIEEWAKAWAQALGVDYLPSIKAQVVKPVKGLISGSIAEISKYATKDADYIYPDDWDLTVDAVRVLDGALANRQLIAYGGDCKEAKRKLKLEDEADGDLINIGDDDKKEQEFKLVTYFWHTGYSQYLGDVGDN